MSGSVTAWPSSSSARRRLKRDSDKMKTVPPPPGVGGGTELAADIALGAVGLFFAIVTE